MRPRTIKSHLETDLKTQANLVDYWTTNTACLLHIRFSFASTGIEKEHKTAYFFLHSTQNRSALCFLDIHKCAALLAVQGDTGWNPGPKCENVVRLVNHLL